MSRKSLLAALLVVMMICCAIFSAGAEAFTVTVSAHMDANNFTQLLQKNGTDISSQLPDGALDAIFGLLDKMAIRATIDGDAVQADLLVSDQPITYIAFQMNDEGLTAVTDLLPSYAAFISADELQQLFAQMKASMASSSGLNLDSINPEDMMNVMQSAIAEFAVVSEKISASYGEAESGSWILSETEFVSRQKLNMSTKELCLVVLEAVDNLTKDQAVQSMMSTFGVSPDKLDVSSALESCKNTPDEQFPPIEIYKYTSASGDEFRTISMETPEVAIYAEFGKIGETFVANCSLNPEYMSLHLAVNTASGDFLLTFDANIQKMGSRSGTPFNTLSVIVKGAGSENDYTVDISFITDNAELMSLKMLFAQGGEITASFDKTGKKVLTLQDIMGIAQGGNSAELDAIKAEITGTGMQLVAKLITLVPEISQLATMFMTMGR